MPQQKFCNVAEKTKALQNARSKKIPARKTRDRRHIKNAQRRKNNTKVAGTTKK